MIDLNSFPITPAMAFTVAGAAAICVLLVQLLKVYLPIWRFTNLLAWVITLVVVELAGIAFVKDATVWERAFNGFLISLAGVSLATFGWELLFNLMGAAGVGPRSDKAILARAKATVRDN